MSEQIVRIKEQRPKLKPPLAMLAELTHRCPLQCPYCSNPTELVRRSGELTTEEWSDVFRQAADLGVLQIHLSGGEPTARADIVELIAAARQAGLYTNLITAGVLMTQSKLNQYVGAGLDHVQLSIQGATPKSTDWIGNFDGAHERKLQVAEWVRAADLPLTVNAVVHRQNLDDLEQIIALAAKLDAHRLEIANVQYYGWALKNRKELLPTPEQIANSAKIVERARRTLQGKMAIDFVVSDYFARRPKRCMDGWGNQFFAISPKGNVLPCHAAETITGLSFSNLRDRKLAWIWRHDEAFNRFRGTDWMPEPCSSCEFRDRDLGGCRCQAFAVTGDASATDPVCHKSPHHQLLEEMTMTDAPIGNVDFTYRR